MRSENPSKYGVPWPYRWKEVFRAVPYAAVLVASLFAALPPLARSAEPNRLVTIEEAVRTALENNPVLAAEKRTAEREDFRIDAARAERLPNVDLIGGVRRARYPQPVTPISGSPLAGAAFPEFDTTLYDYGVAFELPLYMGGRLSRGVAIAGIKRDALRERLRMSGVDLAYNVTSVYYKVLQLEKLSGAVTAAAQALEEHRRLVGEFVSAGTAARVELLKTDSELAHAKENAIAVRNNLESARELLKTLMGVDTPGPVLVEEPARPDPPFPGPFESIALALESRPDYRAALKEKELQDERVRYSLGGRLPRVSLAGQYADTSGTDYDFKENWFVGLRLSMPIFDGGVITAEVAGARKEAEAASERERALRLDIAREVKDAYRSIESSTARAGAASLAVDAAREALRIERIRYSAGSGVTKDVLDAESALLRDEAGYYQARYEHAVAVAGLLRAVGTDPFNIEGEVER